MIVNYTDNQLYPLSPNDRSNLVINVTGGDTIKINTRCFINDIPVNYANSILTFSLRDQRFTLTELWNGTWRKGIEEVEGHSGLICITIPVSISSSLRRGAYIFSLRVSDKLGENIYTTLNGMLQVEVEPTSPNRDIPYQPSGTLP